MIWLILGPSGAGKSSFGSWLAAQWNWLHIEIDRYPEGDGIDLNGLRIEWDEFYSQCSPTALSRAVRSRLEAERKVHCVLTFSGNLVLAQGHISAAEQAGMRIIYLYGSAAHCIESFVKRELQTGRQLTFQHWIENNRLSYLRISEPVFAAYRIHVFTYMGTFRPQSEILKSLLALEDKIE
jgi:adenylate kinase family enzyme